MTDSGCTYIEGKCHPVVLECNGCTNIKIYGDTTYCEVYAEPHMHWSGLYGCAMATHIDRKMKELPHPTKKKSKAKKHKVPSYESVK
jgi:hypothetical protein